MTTALDIKELPRFIKESGDAVDKAISLAQIVHIQRAQVEARKNAQENFIGRNDRRLSGALMNNIFTGYEREAGNDSVTAFIGVKNIPYGAIHEFGGEIKPVKARKLWIPARANAGRMTPREFINIMRSDDRYFITPKGAFREDGAGITPLFYRVDKVKIPERPYLRPALATAYENFADTFMRFYKQEVEKL